MDEELDIDSISDSEEDEAEEGCMHHLADNMGTTILSLSVPYHTSSSEDRQYVLTEALKRGLDISNADLSNGCFEDFDFSGLNLSNVSFYNTSFYNCKLDNVNLSNADLRGITLDENCTYSNWVLPDIYELPAGAFTLWKVVGTLKNDCKNRKSYRYRILQLEVPEDAERVIAFGMPPRVRVSKALPIKLFTLSGIELEVGKFKVYPPQREGEPYIKNTEYLPDSYDGNRFKDCSYGINGFSSFRAAYDYAKSIFPIRHSEDE